MTAGDGLDREAIERRAARAAATVSWADTTASGASFTPGRFTRHYADDVPALLAALKAAEARLRAVIAEMGELFGYEGDDGVQGLRAIAQYALRGEAAAAEVERLRALADAMAEHDARKAIAGRFVAGGWEKATVCERYYPKCCSYHEGFDDALAEYGHVLRTEGGAS